MKNLTTLIAFTIIAFTGYCSNVVASGNGPWTSSSTWNSGVVPASGDNVLIPSGYTVQINSNMNLGSTTFFIQVYGTLLFVGGGSKLIISAASTIYIYGGGTIQGSSNPSEIIKIGSDQVYDAGTLNTISGPSYANSTTPGFLPFTILPVQFISFTLSSESNAILVQWATAQEQNASHFDVEHSENGTNWSVIGVVSATGTTSSVSNYSFTNNNITSAINYYRIKEVDIDGQFMYTTVKMIKTSNTFAADIQISSYAGKAIVQFPSQIEGAVSIRIVSFSGQVITQQNLNSPVGQVILNVGNIAKGAYVISVSNALDLHIAKQVIL